MRVAAGRGGGGGGGPFSIGIAGHMLTSFVDADDSAVERTLVETGSCAILGQGVTNLTRLDRHHQASHHGRLAADHHAKSRSRAHGEHRKKAATTTTTDSAERQMYQESPWEDAVLASPRTTGSSPCLSCF